ncbi:disease resistance protein RPV1-like [Euphorbia lathyris]|uniref:disease resistance protein RPV1-like n=1 Tax=Euphorbia lathyris TaxID=212925 RepID=UPI003313355D
MSASSCSSISHHQMKAYDVFLSFRGADIRNGFLSHLQDALVWNGIDAFIDENLEKGEEISESLVKKIEDSYISVVIFSENYAFSPWCLEELVKILECKKKMGQMVLPVFYRVDPTKIQELEGSYGDALVQHRENFKDSFHKVQRWVKALEETSGLSGLVSCNFKSDAKLIEEIVSNILQNQDHLFSGESYDDDDGLVGIGSQVKRVESLLSLELGVVRIVGIWGMSGIGKTTLAEKVFDQISGHFESQCFVANVTEKFHKCRHSIQNELLSKLFRAGNIYIGNPIMLTSVIRKRLSRKKVLVVFDDVSDLEQIKPMIGKSVDYAVGSRIIVTSKDKQLLKNVNAEIYEVEELDKPEALQLFCLHAFKQNIPRIGFTELSQRAVEYAQGLPLALKILGSDLYGRYNEEWEDKLEKLEGRSDEQLMRIIRTSYDELCTDEKEIFLDIACFLNGKNKDRVLGILNFAGSRFGLSRLCYKSLVYISSNKLYMHDLLRQMGKDIICEEKKLKQRTRLLNPEDIYHVLTEDKGTKAVKAISLDVSKIRNMNLTPIAFEKMFNLRYLELYNSCNGNETKVCLHEGLNFFKKS